MMILSIKLSNNVGVNNDLLRLNPGKASCPPTGCPAKGSAAPPRRGAAPFPANRGAAPLPNPVPVPLAKSKNTNDLLIFY
jgi:hypothetical protein